MKKIILALLVIGTIAGAGKYLNAEEGSDWEDNPRIEIQDELYEDGDSDGEGD